MRPWIAALLLASIALAGCGSGGGGGGGGAPPIDVDEDTGGIRGVVVDQAISPVQGALVTLSGGATTTTGPDGRFNFSRLQPGDYFVTASKAGFRGAQASTTVLAGVAEPPVVRLLLERLTTATPYLDHYKLDGFYECGFGAPFITDSCDFVYRTAWDAYNETQGSPPPGGIPRSVTRFRNTQFIDIPADTWAIVQEGFWEHETITTMMISLDETPIDNACDCSDSYVNVVQESPTHSRLDLLEDDGTTSAPAGVTAAARGFIPFSDPQAATNLQFVIITTLFHNYVPDEAWTFETRDNFPVG